MKVKGVIIQWMSDEDEAALKPRDWPEGTPDRTYIRFDEPQEFDLVDTPKKIDEFLYQKDVEADFWEEVGYRHTDDRITYRHTVGLDATEIESTAYKVHPVTEDQVPRLRWVVQ